jgi:hypothetical protein
MTSIVWRAASSIALAGALAIVFWLAPDLKPDRFAATPDGTMWVFGALFAVFWLYLVVQGYAVSHGNIGSASAVAADFMVSTLPALVALLGIFLNLAGFRELSSFNMVIAVMTLLVAFYDLWILGGSSSKINRLTDEFKTER